LAWADRTQLKPGWNMFSAQQDVEVGQQVSRDAEKQVPMLKDSRVDKYLNNLGQRLSAHAPGYKFPYTYKAVNDRAINAFALPGGPIYINRGVIEAADNETQLAGVMAHETSHVALRHGTNQACNASAAPRRLAVHPFHRPGARFPRLPKRISADAVLGSRTSVTRC
jgi:predicted Zn-dependent protease